jgi:alkanesulfonate monooxygenase SsuD/methylene tetrahydromethanopterin reductase-like flavin-dependent oxidoreductase (luciferase family)
MVPTLFTAEPCGLPQLQLGARLADEAGCEAVWVGDHLLWHVPMLETIATLGALAAMTTQTAVGSNILQLPLRRPLDVAAAFATISHLNDGRVILGIGVGGEYPPEWEAAGVDLKTRGRRADEAIDALRWFWNGESGQGEFFVSPGVKVQPAVDPHPPIWVGGRSEAAIRRAARTDGYLGVWISASRITKIREQIAEERGSLDGHRFALQVFTRMGSSAETARAEALEAMAQTYKIDPAPFSRYVAAGSAEDIAELCQEMAAVGVDHLSFYLVGPGWEEQAQQLAEEVLPLVHEISA